MTNFVRFSSLVDGHILIDELQAAERENGRLLPPAYCDLVRDLHLAIALFQFELIRCQVQPGHADREARKGGHKQADQVLRQRVASLRKELYWMKAELTRSRGVLQGSDSYQAFMDGCERLVEPGSRSLFPVIKLVDACSTCTKRPNTGYCAHDVEKIFRGSNHFSEQFVKKEMRKWHPDRWVGKGKIQAQAQEMFTMLQSILEGEV